MKASFLQSAVVCCCMREREGGTSNKRSTRVAIARYREREFKQTCPSLFCTYSRNSTLFNFVRCKSIAAWGLADLHSAKKLSMHQLENIHLKTTTTTTLNEDFKKKTEKQRENYIYVHMLLMVELLSKSRDAHSSIPSANFNLSAGTVRATDCITISSRKSSAKFTKQKNYYLKPPSKNPIQLCLSLSLSPQHREKPRFPTWFKLSRTKKKKEPHYYWTVNPKGLAPKIPGAAKTQKRLYLNDDLRQGLRNCPKLIILQDEFSPETLQESLSPSRILWNSFFSES